MKISLPVYATINGIFLFLEYAIYKDALNFPKMEEREWDFQDGLGFAVHSEPVLGLCFLFNAWWLFKSIRDIWQHKRYRSLVALVLVIGAWAALYYASYYMT